MKNQNFLFIVFSLVMVLGLMQSYHRFQEYFSPHVDDLKKIKSLQSEVERQKLKVSLLENQVVDFQQEVAQQLPALDMIKGDPTRYQIRSLASVTQKPLQAFEMVGPLSERARAEFRKGEYKASVKSFKEITEKYPATPMVVEAYFFWAESLYLNNQHQECLDVIEQMMIQFPAHELTGFIMLRMGQVLQARNRTEEAKEVFEVVGQKFSLNHELKIQAEKLAKAVE